MNKNKAKDNKKLVKTLPTFAKTIGFVSLGCDKNRVDTEKIITTLSNYSCFSFVGNKRDANIIIINTCSFLKIAREESKKVINEMGKLKETANLEKLIVVGCLPLLIKEKLLEEFSFVDCIVVPKDYFKIDEIIFNLYGIKSIKRDKIVSSRLTTSSNAAYAYLKIADGCNNMCAFCKIPAIRGNYKSVPIDELVLEATNLCNRGIKEIILVAQDITRYGCDIKTNLVELLHALSKIKNLSWIRLLYCYPEKINAELINEIKNNPKIVKYIDIPLQHISNNVLTLMKRRGDKKYIENLIKTLRREIKDIKIRSTFMVGFPGETEKDFKELCNFLKKYKLDNVGFFKYSREEGTSSYNLPNQVDESVKNRRLKTVENLQNEIANKKNLKLKNKIFKVLCDEFDTKNKLFVGRNYFSAPGVDFDFLIIPHKKIKVGAFIDVRVLDFNKGYFIGEVVENEDLC